MNLNKLFKFQCKTNKGVLLKFFIKKYKKLSLLSIKYYFFYDTEGNQKFLKEFNSVVILFVKVSTNIFLFYFILRIILYMIDIV